MYPSLRRQIYVKGWSVILPLALYTPICPRHPGVTEHCSVWEVIKRPITSRLHRNLTSPGYSAGSARWLLKYHCPHVDHRPPSVVIWLHSKYRLIAPSLKGDLGAPFELGLFTPREHNVDKVLDEWVFNIFKILYYGDFPLHLTTDIFLKKSGVSTKIFLNFFVLPFLLHTRLSCQNKIVWHILNIYTVLRTVRIISYKPLVNFKEIEIY